MDTGVAFEGRRHLLTVNLEDYFQVGTLRSVIRPSHWYRFENRVVTNTRKALDLLEETNVKATFFTLGWIADEIPEILREVVERGHEIASKGYYHRSLAEMSPGEFREEILSSRESIERACGRKVYGYRIARGWFAPHDLWALDILAEEDYAYDSSLRPFLRSMPRGDPRRVSHIHRAGTEQIWEFPLSTWSFAGFSVPIAGGNYMRQFPNFLVKRAACQWDRKINSPFVMYFHVWELDPEQPRVRAAPLFQRVRQYRNLGKMPHLIRDYLQRYRFTSIANHLGLLPLTVDAGRSVEAIPVRLPAIVGSVSETPMEPEGVVPIPAATPGPKRGVTVVVPCYNEEVALPYLANTLRSVVPLLSRDYAIRLVFVDDCSTDRTWKSLEDLFGNHPDCQLVRHDRNRGVAAAILTGIEYASTEIVCSIDCDCSYDPHELAKMIPLLDPDVDLVTASPYHVRGKALNVPCWRLTLSKSLSALYRLVLKHKLATYTSCFRVYRRSSLSRVEVREGGFLGVAEMLAKLDLMGYRIVEFPTVLEVRLLGESKMRILTTIFGHLRLLGGLFFTRKKFAKLATENLLGRKVPVGSLDRTSRIS